MWIAKNSAYTHVLDGEQPWERKHDTARGISLCDQKVEDAGASDLPRCSECRERSDAKFRREKRGQRQREVR